VQNGDASRFGGGVNAVYAAFRRSVSL